MPLNKPSQQLRRDLTGFATDLKWATADLLRIAERLSLAGNEPNAQALLKICWVMKAEDKLAGYGDEVRYRPIMRERAE